MIDYEKHLQEIKETQRQISKTESRRRKADLQKHLKKLWKQYDIARSYLKGS